jgi:hypothetical protein
MLLLESFFVGIYSVFILIILSLFIENKFILFFVLGFIKHYMGYYTGIHDYYCQIKTGKAISGGSDLFIESLLEGLAFAAANNLLLNKITNDYDRVFFIGFMFHLLSEYSGIHNYFLTGCIAGPQ